MKKISLSVLFVCLIAGMVLPCGAVPGNGGMNDEHPFGEAASFQQRNPRKQYITHIVNTGETLYSIAQKYGMSVDDIRADNGNIGDNTLRTGMQIRIDRNKMNSVRPETVQQKSTQPAAEMNRTPVNSGYVDHLVKPQETIYSLSKQYNVGIDEIKRANPALERQGLREGEVIRIPAASVPVPEDRAMPAVRNSRHQSNSPENKSVPSDLSRSDKTFGNDSLSSTSPYQGRYYSPLKDRRSGIRKHFDARNPVNAALILPLKSDNGQINRNFLDFYQGFLLAVDSMKRGGLSVELSVFNTADRSVESLREVISWHDMDRFDIIFGPVYDEQFEEMAKYMETLANRTDTPNIPLVSPLGAVSARYPNVFQVAPDDSRKSEKLKNILTGDKNIILFTTGADDSEFMAEIRNVLPSGYKTLSYYKGIATGTINALLESDRENIIIAGSANETDMEELLSRISSIQSTYYNKKISVVATNRLARFKNIDLALLFKLNTRYVTSYHTDRGNAEVEYFDAQYISMFGSLPTPFAYRGYDVGMFFLGGMKEFGSDFYRVIDAYKTRILQTYYRFERQPSGRFDNTEWMLINYTPYYDIVAE